MATSAIQIEELTGKKRSLILTGSALPLKPAGFAGETGLVTTFYNGNREGSQQVLAPKLSPSDWNGMWRTTNLLRSPAKWVPQENASPIEVGYAFALAEIVESIRESAQLLRVTFTNVSNAPSTGIITVQQRSWKVSRIGRLGEFEFTPDNLDDIGWKVSFVWVGKSAAPTTVTENFGIDSIVSAIQEAINSQTAVESLPTRVRTPVPNHLTLGQIEQFTQAPLQMVDSFARAATNLTMRMKDLGDIILKVRDIPASLYGRALDVANTGVSVSNNFMDQISRTSSESLANRQKVSSLTRSLSYYSGAMTQAQLMSESNASLAIAARKMRARGLDPSNPRVESGGVIAMYMPKDGDTMLGISQRFYDGADLSSELCKANGLEAYRVKPPKYALVIPTRAVLQSLSQRTL